MQARVLGARQGESRHTHFGTILVDGVLALDAGGLTSTLTLQEQAAIRAVLLTHRHYDHVKDLAALGFNLMGRGQVSVCCTSEVRAVLEATILGEQLWIDFFVRPTAQDPTFVHICVEPDLPFTLGEYRIRPVSVEHSVPALGYEITAPSGSTLLYTGDNGPGSGKAWASARPELLITEVTYSDAKADLAAQHGHLTPQLLADEMEAFRAIRGYVPRVLVVHVNPYEEDQIAAGIAAVASDLSADLHLAEEDRVYRV